MAIYKNMPNYRQTGGGVGEFFNSANWSKLLPTIGDPKSLPFGGSQVPNPNFSGGAGWRSDANYRSDLASGRDTSGVYYEGGAGGGSDWDDPFGSSLGTPGGHDWSYGSTGNRGMVAQDIDPITGQPTLPHLPGVGAHEDLNRQIGEGGGAPVVDATKSPDEVYKDILGIEADPTSQPDYYGGATVAEFDPAQIEGFRQRELAAHEQNRLAQEQLARAEGRLDPNSAYSQRLQRQAAQQASGAFGGAGSFGGLKSQGAVGHGTQAALLDSQRQAEADISNLSERLTQGAETLGKVGSERRKYVQDVINEDIKRWNFAQLAPQQQRDRVLALASQLKAMELGSVIDPRSGTSVPAWKNILASAVSSQIGDAAGGVLDKILGGLGFGNQGGAVYRQMGGPAMGDPMMEGDPMMQQDPMAPPAPAPSPMGGIADPMMEEPMGGIMDAPMEPGMDMGMDMEGGITGMMEPESTIDSLEESLSGLPGITIKRKKVKVKGKKKGG